MFILLIPKEKKKKKKRIMSNEIELKMALEANYWGIGGNYF